MSEHHEFDAELAQIHDGNLRTFVCRCLDEITPDYFWTCPASRSGKYHPALSLGKGGLVRHTKLAVWWGVHLGTAFILSVEDQNYVTAALILHDTHKCGNDLSTTPADSVAMHGIWTAEAVKQLADIEATVDGILLYDLIAGHMGRWTHFVYPIPVGPSDSNPTAILVVHLADYAASRKVDEITHRLTHEGETP